MPENRFGAGAKRGFCGSQSQAGLAIQPLGADGFVCAGGAAVLDGIAIFASWAAICEGFAAIHCHFASLRGRVLSEILGDQRGLAGLCYPVPD